MCSNIGRRLITASQVVARGVFAGHQFASSKAPFTSPLELTESDVSKVYCVPKNEVKTTFPHGLPRTFADQTNVLGQVCWVLRRQSYDIMRNLKAEGSSKFLIYGDDGCGKSLCMHQVMQWCVRAGWMVIHIPSVLAWTHSQTELRPSTKHIGCYNLHKEASSWLKNFRSANSQFLSQIKLSKDHYWTKKEMSPAGMELSKVMEQGLLKPNLATEVVSVVLEEVSGACESFKLLLAVDDFNGCFNPTTLKLKDKEWLEPDQLNLVRCVMEYVTPGKAMLLKVHVLSHLCRCGAVLLALSRTGMYRHSVPGCEPAELLGDKGMEMVRKYEMVRVPHYEREEMDNCLNYYIQERWFTKKLTPFVGDELWHLTAGSPRELNRLCSAL